MSTTTQSQIAASGKQKYLATFDREVATTLKLLRAYPAAQSELRPHEKLKTARELAWIFVMEAGMATAALQDELQMPPSGPPPEAPANLAEVITAFEAATRRLHDVVESASEESLAGTVRFFVAPKTLGDVPKMDFLWFLLHDQIHHRGQFSIYQRIAGGKVPSIYGPSADEPWF